MMMMMTMMMMKTIKKADNPAGSGEKETFPSMSTEYGVQSGLVSFPPVFFRALTLTLLYPAMSTAFSVSYRTNHTDLTAQL